MRVHHFGGVCRFELSILPLNNPRINRVIGLKSNTGTYGIMVYLKPPYDGTTHYDFYVNGELFLDKIEINRETFTYVLSPLVGSVAYEVYCIAYTLDGEGTVTHNSLSSNVVFVNGATDVVGVCEFSIGGISGRLWNLNGILLNNCTLCKE